MAHKVASAVMLCATLSLGCSASMVTKPGTVASAPAAYAPVNEGARPGVVKYLNEGIGSVREKRRQDAYKKMHEACGGPYRIDAEGPRVEGGVVVPVGDAAAVIPSQYWYIQFSCVPPADSSAH
jgi:hypothetical protein